MTYTGDPTDYSEFANRITDSITEFCKKLKDSQIQHTSTQAFGEVVVHYAKAVIDVEFRYVKYKFVDGEIKLIQEIDADDVLKL